MLSTELLFVLNLLTLLLIFVVTSVGGRPGDRGTDGEDGLDGSDGDDGSIGRTGLQGPEGERGAVGPTGPLGGPPGPRGEQGPIGPQGRQGAQGTQGCQGQQGSQGVQGIQGNQGNQGTQGSQGQQGSQGVQGIQGNQGSQGTQGQQGGQGSQGVQGIQGNQGSQGTQGQQGGQGAQGSQGVQGIQGNQGSQGTQGQQGGQGSQGSQGTQGQQGGQGNQGTQGNQGSQGIQGMTGPPGVVSVTNANGTDFSLVGSVLNGSMTQDLQVTANPTFATVNTGQVNSSTGGVLYLNANQTNSTVYVGDVTVTNSVLQVLNSVTNPCFLVTNNQVRSFLNTFDQGTGIGRFQSGLYWGRTEFSSTTSTTLTAAELFGGLLSLDPGSVTDVTFTMPTGANIIAAIPNVSGNNVGAGFIVQVSNLNATQDLILAPNIATTFIGANLPIPPQQNCNLLVVVNAAGTAVEVYQNLSPSVTSVTNANGTNFSIAGNVLTGSMTQDLQTTAGPTFATVNTGEVNSSTGGVLYLNRNAPTSTLYVGDIGTPSSVTMHVLTSTVPVAFLVQNSLVRTANNYLQSDTGNIGNARFNHTLWYGTSRQLVSTSFTLSAQNLANGLIEASASMASDITITMPTATDIMANIPGTPAVGSASYWVEVANEGSTYFMYLAPNTGTSISGNNYPVLPNQSFNMLVRVNAAATAVVIYPNIQVPSYQYSTTLTFDSAAWSAPGTFDARVIFTRTGDVVVFQTIDQMTGSYSGNIGFVEYNGNGIKSLFFPVASTQLAMTVFQTAADRFPGAGIIRSSPPYIRIQPGLAFADTPIIPPFCLTWNASLPWSVGSGFPP